jgi:hypothetical protein
LELSYYIRKVLNVLVIVPTEKDSKWGNMEEIYIKGENKGIIAVPFHNNEFF